MIETIAWVVGGPIRRILLVMSAIIAWVAYSEGLDLRWCLIFVGIMAIVPAELLNWFLDWDAKKKYRTSKPFSSMARDYWEAKEFDLAIEQCSLAIENDSHDSNMYNYRGTIYADKGDLDQAIADFTSTINMRANLRGRGYRDIHDKRSGSGPLAWAFYRRCCCYYDKRDFELALSDVGSCLATIPESLKDRLGPKDFLFLVSRQRRSLVTQSEDFLSRRGSF